MNYLIFLFCNFKPFKKFIYFVNMEFSFIKRKRDNKFKKRSNDPVPGVQQ